MTALHSCFVAGLTLVYCLWRDRALFSYDALEAARACSQSLTIFGEKWPGAVKYRDIFDALSGSLFKAIVDPSPSKSSGAGLEPLRVDLQAEPVGSPTNQGVLPLDNTERAQSGESSRTTHPVSNAVKEAFMEVDEEAPGGWQGWRMFNEMVQHDMGPSQGVQPSGGDGTSGQEFYGLEFGQEETVQMGIPAMMDSEWDFGGLEGLR